MSLPPRIEKRSVFPRLSTPVPNSKTQSTGLVPLADLVRLYRSGKYLEVASQASSIMRGLPDTVDRLNLCGAAFHAMSHYVEAETHFREALQLRKSEKLHNNLGNAIRAQGRHNEAVTHYRIATEINPRFAEAYNNLGNALKDIGQKEEALSCYDKAIALRATYDEAIYNKANALQELERIDEAETLYRSILIRNPKMAHARNNLARVLLDSGRQEEALEHLSVAAKLLPNSPEVLNNLGNALKEMRRLDAAAECYQKAIKLNPRLSSALVNLGTIQLAVGKNSDARKNFLAAIHQSPNLITARIGLAISLDALKKEVEAISEYRKVLEIDPELSETRSKLLHMSADLCDWSQTETDLNEIQSLEHRGKTVFPFAMLPFCDDPQVAQMRAQRYTQHHYPKVLSLPPERGGRKKKSNRLTIGYFSADFREHVIGRLIVRILENHDQERFEVIAYDLSNRTDTAEPDNVRSRVIAAVDSFVPCSRMTDQEIALRARLDGVDVAIDLTGYTTGGRVGIMAQRAAPLQISYLGFPGSMGATFYDYLIADRHIIPESERNFYTENIIYMPGSYLVIDDTLRPEAPRNSREELGLLEGHFTFCCFNAAYKINRSMMELWCEILRETSETQLWLYAKNDVVRSNLLRFATSQEVDPRRLVFMGAQKYADYLSNLKHADLFLDTFPYNANATANDALFAGIPVLTKQGRNLISRAASGLLSTLRLPELIAHSSEEYVASALAIAKSPTKLAELKACLNAAREETRIFDSCYFTRAFERGIQSAYEIKLSRSKLIDISL